MDEIGYEVRGFLTIRKQALRAPLHGSLVLRVDRGSRSFSGDLELGESAVRRTVFGASLLRATVQITADSPVDGRIDHEDQVSATVTVNAAILTLRVSGRNVVTGGGSCRTATHAVVPLHSRPGFDLDRGGRLAGRYSRPPFTGCGWITPVLNLLAAGPGNAVVIDLIPRTAAGTGRPGAGAGRGAGADAGPGGAG
jgi:hypothetical protein